MSFPNRNQPLPPVPAPSRTAETLSQKAKPVSLVSSEWSPSTTTPIPGNKMGPPQPPQNRMPDAQFELNQNLVRPTTVDGAVDWINRHKPQIDHFLTLLEQYPQLVNLERLDAGKNPLPPIKRSVSESDVMPPRDRRQNTPASHLDNRHRRRKHRSGDKVGHFTRGKVPSIVNGDKDNDRDDIPSSERYIYVCDVLPQGGESPEKSSGVSLASLLPSFREKIVTALSTYCFVRTGPDRLQSEAEFVELTHTIANADAFVLLMNERVLASGTCLHQLAVAAAYDVPIIPIREDSFKLPEQLASELYDIEIIRLYGKTGPEDISEHDRHTVTKRSQSERDDLLECHSSGLYSEGEDIKHSTLADLVTDCYKDSLLYVPKFHNSCVSKLLGKLSEYLGEAYLDFEVGRQIGGGDENFRLAMRRIGDRTVSLQFPAMNKGVLKPIRSERGDNVSTLPLKDDSGCLCETPMSIDSGTPTSIAKLPPISKPADRMSQKSRETDGMSLSADESIEFHESQSTAQSSLLDSDQSDWDISPESSPFLETKYIVFPSSEPGFEKRAPFTVNFPHDISTIDRRRSSASTDDYGFNYVKLDFEYDIIAPSPIGIFFSDDEEEEKPKIPPPKKETKPRVKKPPKPIQVKVRNNRPVREQQLVKMATISIKYGMPV